MAAKKVFWGSQTSPSAINTQKALVNYRALNDRNDGNNSRI
jgi:hypothetical protein